MNHPIPTVIYRIGDLKNAFMLVHAQHAATFGAEAAASEMTMGNALLKGVKASLEVLEGFNAADCISLPDVPSELTKALHGRLTKSLAGYVQAGEYRIITENEAKAFIPH